MSSNDKIKGLFNWCVNQTKNYKNVKITNFTSSWRNGLGFCAILHQYGPEFIDYSNLNPEDVYKNCELAFVVGENQFGIPALLDAKDMVLLQIPDRLSIITYLFQYYSTLSSKIPKILNSGYSISEIENISDFTQKEDNIKKSPDLKGPKEERRDIICEICSRTIYFLEKMQISNKYYHRSCYRQSQLVNLKKRNATLERTNDKDKLDSAPDNNVKHPRLISPHPDEKTKQVLSGNSNKSNTEVPDLVKVNETNTIDKDDPNTQSTDMDQNRKSILDSTTGQISDDVKIQNARSKVTSLISSLKSHESLDKNVNKMDVDVTIDNTKFGFKTKDSVETKGTFNDDLNKDNVNSNIGKVQTNLKSQELFHKESNKMLVDVKIDNTKPYIKSPLVADIKKDDARSKVCSVIIRLQSHESLEKVSNKTVKSQLTENSSLISRNEEENVETKNIVNINTNSIDDVLKMENAGDNKTSSSHESFSKESKKTSEDITTNRVIIDTKSLDYDARETINAHTEGGGLDKFKDPGQKNEATVPSGKLEYTSNNEDQVTGNKNHHSNLDENVVAPTIRPSPLSSTQHLRQPSVNNITDKNLGVDIRQKKMDLESMYDKSITESSNDKKQPNRPSLPPKPSFRRDSDLKPGAVDRVSGSKTFDSDNAYLGQRVSSVPKPTSSNLHASCDDIISLEHRTTLDEPQHSKIDTIVLSNQSLDSKETESATSSKPLVQKRTKFQVVKSKSNDCLNDSSLLTDTNNNNMPTPQRPLPPKLVPVRPKPCRPAPARPLTEKRQVRADQLFIPYESIYTELKDVDEKQSELEKKGRHLQKSLKKQNEKDEGYDRLLQEWLEIVEQKRVLYSREKCLHDVLKTQELEDRHSDLEYEYRLLFGKQESLKTAAERAREDELLNQIILTVDARNKLVDDEAESLNNSTHDGLPKNKTFLEKVIGKKFRSKSLIGSQSIWKKSKATKTQPTNSTFYEDK